MFPWLVLFLLQHICFQAYAQGDRACPLQHTCTNSRQCNWFLEFRKLKQTNDAEYKRRLPDIRKFICNNKPQKICCPTTLNLSPSTLYTHSTHLPTPSTHRTGSDSNPDEPHVVNIRQTDMCQHDNGQDYTGNVSTTKSGFTCQRWNNQSPHMHRFGLGDHNYCRNPDAEHHEHGVWCYTTDPNKKWEECDVPFCGEKKITITKELEVSDVCCFIITTKTKGTWILTDHIFRDPDFNSTCQRSQCAYSPYENSPTIHTTKQKCLSEFGEEYTCCSENTGAFCEDYTGIRTKKNIISGGCSEDCKEIADCSSDPENVWCRNVKVKIVDEEKDHIEEPADYIPHALYQEIIDHSHLTDEEKEYHCEFHSPCPHHPTSLSHLWSQHNETGCFTCSHKFELNVSNHPKYSPFRKIVRHGYVPTFIPHTPTFNRGKREAPRIMFPYCHSVHFWVFTCMHCEQYAGYPTKINYYQKEAVEKWFKNGCCPGMQPTCSNTNTITCPSFDGQGNVLTTGRK